ncbi:heavy metal-associated domain-containing protein [Nostoc sp.]
MNKSIIRDRITALGYTTDIVPANRGKTLQAKISGMDCAGCAKTIEAALS